MLIFSNETLTQLSYLPATKNEGVIKTAINLAEKYLTNIDAKRCFEEHTKKQNGLEYDPLPANAWKEAESIACMAVLSANPNVKVSVTLHWKS